MLATLRGMLARVHLERRAEIGASVRILGRIWIRGEGKIRIGSRVVLDASAAPIELHATHPHSEIVLGDDVVVESGTSIEAEKSIVVGDRVKIRRFCRLMDSHFHPTTGDRNQRPPPSPIVIESDVEMGARAIVLAGAHIERDVSICPGTLVTRGVRAGSTVRGVPAQVVDAIATTGGAK